MANEFARGVITKEGPSFTILQSCTDCKYFNPGLGKCEELDILLNGRLPNASCKFLVKNSIIYFESEILRLKNEDRNKISAIIMDIFPDCYDFEYTDTEISIQNEDLDLNDIEKIKTKLPDYCFHVRPYDSDSFCICFTKIIRKN